MEFNLQISNWLVSAMGGFASWALTLAAVLLLLMIVNRVRQLKSADEAFNLLSDRSLVVRCLALGFFVWVLIGFNSNAPKIALEPDYSAEQQAIESHLAEEPATEPVKDMSPPRDSAAETTQHLQALREAQKREAQTQ